MAHRGSISGAARLLVNGEDAGPVTYEIDVFQDRALQDANGRIEADSKALRDAFHSKDARLKTDAGEIKIILSRYNSGREAEIEVSGPVPGF